MSSRAQSSLEYILTYGWALVLVATAVGVAILVFMPPAEETRFRSSDPTRIVIKGGSIEGIIADIIAQNITGQGIEIINIAMPSGYSLCTVNGVTITGGAISVAVAAGAEIRIHCENVSDASGKISMQYRDRFGITRSVDIDTSGPPDTTPTGTPISACGTIISEAGTYYLSQDLTTAAGTCITVNAGNVTLNGNGKTLNGSGTASRGVYVQSGQGNKVLNFTVTGFTQGISLDSGSDSTTVNGNTATNNTYGIYNYSSDNSTISGNTVNSNSGSGIYLISFNNTVSGNTANGNGHHGIELYPNVTGNTISGNTLNSNASSGVYVPQAAQSNTISGNTLSGNYIGIQFELAGSNTAQSNTISSSTYCGIYVKSSTSISLTGNTVSANPGAIGIYLYNTPSGHVLTGNTVAGNYVGIRTNLSNLDQILSNTVSGNTTEGILVMNGSRESLRGNTISSNGREGIRLSASFTTQVASNSSCGNGGGNPIYEDFDCGDSTSTFSMFENNFDTVNACADNGFPQLGVDYSPC